MKIGGKNFCNGFELEKFYTELMELKISGTNITAEETVFLCQFKIYNEI